MKITINANLSRQVITESKELEINLPDGTKYYEMYDKHNYMVISYKKHETTSEASEIHVMSIWKDFHEDQFQIKTTRISQYEFINDFQNAFNSRVVGYDSNLINIAIRVLYNLDRDDYNEITHDEFLERVSDPLINYWNEIIK